MTFEAYDADGNLIEGVIPPDEIAAKLAELEDTRQKLAKLENKELNFKKFRDMNEEERSKLSATEAALKQQQEALEEQQRTFTETFVKDIKTDVLKILAGDDEELQKKIEHNYSRLKDSENAKSREEISTLMNEAYVLSVGSSKAPNPLVAAINHSGSAPVAKQAATLSDDAIAVGAKLGISAEDIKKYS